MDFISHDQNTTQDIMKKIGINSFNELYENIPKNLLLDSLNLPKGLSEANLLKKLKIISQKNHIYSTSFLGAGSYFHYIPSLVDYTISRSEFYTSYTPYQAEASQGMLQCIYEFQTAITRLTKMDVTNASMYDCASALAEAATMCSFATGKNKIIMIKGIHPEYIETVNTYCWGRNIQTEIIPLNKLEEKITDDHAGVLFQSPNFFGDIEDSKKIAEIVHSKTKKTKVVQAVSDPTCLGILTPPGKNNIDIFVSEGVGLPPSFGGPNLGIFATTKKLMRKMPGRVIGKTQEIDGLKKGLILTLQAREQHIRREKASSNICSNQSLCMIANLVYLVSLGKTGLKEVCNQNFQKAHYVKKSIEKISGYKIINKKPTYNEFVVECPNIDKFIKNCKEMDILPPLQLSHYFPKDPNRKNQILVCVTENNSKLDIENFIKAAENASSEGKIL